MTSPGLRPGSHGVLGSARLGVAAALMTVVAASVLPAVSPAGAATPSHWVLGQGGTLTVGIDQAPSGCNPNTASGDTWADRFVLAPVLPGAFVVSGNQASYNSAVISQAELQSTSPERIVYTINPKAVWSDGRPITAADFIYTWEQERGTTGPVGGATATPPVLGPPPASALPPGTTSMPGATGLTGPALGYRQISSVTASNKGRTVTVVFDTPYADWQSLFDDLLPAHVLARTGWDPTCSTVSPKIDLSGGPFMVARSSSSQVVLTRNPRWWETPANLDRIVIKIASGPSQLAAWLQRRKVDVALPASYGQRYLQMVSANPALATDNQITATLLTLELSTTSTLTASSDMRLAIAHAIDRRQLVNSVVGWDDSTIAPAASHLYSQTQAGYPSPRPPPLQVAGQPGATPTTTPTTPTATTPFPVTADPLAVSKLLGGLGYVRAADGYWSDPTGNTLTVRLAVDAADGWAAASAAVLSGQLEAEGIAVTSVNARSAGAAGEALSSGAADLALLPLHADPYASQAIAWYTPLLGPPGSGGSQDWSNLDDPALDSLLVNASQQLNPTKTAKADYAQADALLWQDMVSLPLFSEPTVLASSGMVGGPSVGPETSAMLASANGWAIRVPPTSPRAAQSR